MLWNPRVAFEEVATANFGEGEKTRPVHFLRNTGMRTVFVAEGGTVSDMKALNRAFSIVLGLQRVGKYQHNPENSG